MEEKKITMRNRMRRRRRKRRWEGRANKMTAAAAVTMTMAMDFMKRHQIHAEAAGQIVEMAQKYCKRRGWGTQMTYDFASLSSIIRLLLLCRLHCHPQ